METINIIIAACVTVFSFGLLIISLVSYNRSKNLKLLFVSMVFLILLLRGLLLSISLLIDDFDTFVTMPFSGLLDLFILVFLFIATLKR